MRRGERALCDDLTVPYNYPSQAPGSTSEAEGWRREGDGQGCSLLRGSAGWPAPERATAAILRRVVLGTNYTSTPAVRRTKEEELCKP